MPFHLRYTPHDTPFTESDQRNLADNFTEKFDKYIIARESLDKKGNIVPTHYHCYIESDLDIDTIRYNVQKWLNIPKGGSGRNNKYYMLKKWNEDISYICKQNNIVSYKGFSNEDLVRPPSCQIQENNTPPPATPVKKKESNFWNEILERAILWEKSQNKKIETEEALKIISRVYFTKGLPLPHPGDRKRWATSLVMYSKMQWEYVENKHDHILEEEACHFIGEHMVSNKS